jgi:hypothetical protein
MPKPTAVFTVRPIFPHVAAVAVGGIAGLAVLAGAAHVRGLHGLRQTGRLVTLGLTNNSTPEHVAQAIIGESKCRGQGLDESTAEVSTGRTESGLQMVKHPTADWWGYYQQDASYLNRRDPAGNVLGFLDRLAARSGLSD